jgi:uncharacterized protein YodC (DUF2158 family)
MFNLIKKYMNDKKNNTDIDNSGNYNSGDYNSGNRNSGYCNSGDYNSGYCNSGDRNSGDYNSGYYNSGYYNSGYYNSGWFNRNEPKMRMFEKESEYTYSEFREKFGYNDISLPTCVWVNKEDMTDVEKKLSTSWETTGGYLKVLGYKEAWAKAWNEASQKVKDWYKSLPNFDEKIFEDITGIKPSVKETIKIGNNTYDKSEVEKALENVKSL